MNCYRWELAALLEGLALKRLDERENLAEMTFHLRYVLNAKKPKIKKVLNKAKEEIKIKRIFRKSEDEKEIDSDRLAMIKKASEYFKNKNRR
jgi:hypothetical protein